MGVREAIPWLLTVLAVAIPVEDAMQGLARMRTGKLLRDGAYKALAAARSDRGLARMRARMEEKLRAFDRKRPEELFLAVWADPEVCCGQESAPCWTARARTVQAGLAEARAAPPDEWPWAEADLRRLGVRSVQRAFRLGPGWHAAYAKTEWGSDWYAVGPLRCG